MHQHRCATKNCPNFYVCHTRDCRLTWQCPTCEDNTLFDDIQRMNQEQQQRTQTHGNRREGR